MNYKPSCDARINRRVLKESACSILSTSTTSVKNGRVWYMMLFKADNFGDTVKGLEEPVILTVWTDNEEEK